MESRVLRASSKTLHLHLAKMPWLNRHLAKEAASCDILVPNPKYTGLFSKSRPKNHLSWAACLLWKSSSLRELLSKLVMRRGLMRRVSASQKTWCHAQPGAGGFPSCLSEPGFPACHKWATQGGRRWDQALSPLSAIAASWQSGWHFQLTRT